MGVFGLLALQRVDKLEEELNRLKKEQGLTDQSEHDTDEMQITENDLKALFAAIACVVSVALIVSVSLVLCHMLH